MADTIQYNNISERLKKLIVWPTDSSGRKADTVVYEWAHKTTMYERNADDERSLVETHPGNYLPSTDTIFDAEQDEYIMLAYYETMRPGAPGTNNPATPVLLPIEFTAENRGFLYVPNTGRGRKLFQFLELCNANASSANPDAAVPSIGTMFSRVKPEATAEDQLDRKVEVMRLSNLIMEMDLASLKELAPRVGVNATLDKNQLKMALISKAEVEPAVVNANMNTEAAAIVADVQRAISRKIIAYSEDEGGYVWYENQVLLATIPASVVDKAAALAEFLGGSENGLRLRGKIVDAASTSRRSAEGVDTTDYRPKNPRQQKTAAASQAKKGAGGSSNLRPKVGGKFVKKEVPAPADSPASEEGEADY